MVSAKEPPYDVFISYRRLAAHDLALLLQRELRQHGVRSFLDHDLKRGVFDETLLRHIAESKNFLIILTPNALDRCSDPEDWLRREIIHAIKTKRNIIPLTDSFQFTSEAAKSLDPAIREIFRYQAVVCSRDYLDNTIDRIVKIVEQDKVESPQHSHTYGWRPVWITSTVASTIGIIIAALWFFFAHHPERPSLQSNQEPQLTTPQPNLNPIPTPTTVCQTASETTNQDPGFAPGTTRTDLKYDLKYVWIPPGTFCMGCSPDDLECVNDETPIHKVIITKGFWLETTPVTEVAYYRVIGDKSQLFSG
ncbi:MAG TPA: TIR domain-containing protein [Candidatus Angelobacter sp.]|jgi:hypothetical protein|nr:TIR domain-containing protein [Candidatus Angelobacter sp.]